MACIPPNPRRVGYIDPIHGPLDGPLYMGSHIHQHQVQPKVAKTLKAARLISRLFCGLMLRFYIGVMPQEEMSSGIANFAHRFQLVATPESKHTC